jgi:hypothetical protein
LLLFDSFTVVFQFNCCSYLYFFLLDCIIIRRPFCRSYCMY